MNDHELLPAPANLGEAMEMARALSVSGMLSKDFCGKPNNILIAMMWAKNLNIPTVQALQGIAVINGKASIYGDMMLAVVRGSGKLESIEEKYIGDDPNVPIERNTNLTAVCTVKRVGDKAPFVSTFSIREAQQAGLLGKIGPWKQYPKRMLKMRARNFALRDCFADVLCGVACAEEMEDIEGTASEKTDTAQTTAVPPAASAPKMPRKAPSRKTSAPAAEDAKIVEPKAIENNPSPAAETVIPQAKPSEPVPVEAKPAEPQQTVEAAKPAEPPKPTAEPPAAEPATAKSYDVEIIRKQFAAAQTNDELVSVWKNDLSSEAHRDKVVVEMFKARRLALGQS